LPEILPDPVKPIVRFVMIGDFLFYIIFVEERFPIGTEHITRCGYALPAMMKSIPISPIAR
jgi:hypothetical protein